MGFLLRNHEQFTSDDDYDDDDDDNVEHHSPSNDSNVESQDYDYQNDDHTPQLIDQHDYSKHQQQTPTNFHSISSAISPKLQRLLSTTLSSVQHRTPPQSVNLLRQILIVLHHHNHINNMRYHH